MIRFVLIVLCANCFGVSSIANARECQNSINVDDFLSCLIEGHPQLDIAKLDVSVAEALTDKAWPVMPSDFFSLAQKAAEEAGFSDFSPNSCLINRYEPGARMALHQDKDEGDFSHPIVSISLGLTA